MGDITLKEKIHAYFRLFRLHTAATESLLVLIGALIIARPSNYKLILLPFILN